MKKSEIEVTMPMTTYEEIIKYKEFYLNLTDELKNCCTFNEEQKLINFNLNEVFSIVKRYIPNRYSDYNVDIIRI